MATPPGITPADDFAARILDLERQVQELKSRPSSVPILAAAPDASYAGNVWGYPDGRLIWRLKDGTLRQVSSVAATAASGSNPAQPAQPTTHQTTWGATWAQAYRSNGGKTGGDDRYLYYGNSGASSYNGRQKSLVNFDYAAIQAALAGATISAVEIFLQNIHTWANSGATCWVGAQLNAVGSAPGSYGGAVHDFVSSFHTARDTGAWHTVSTEFGQRLRDAAATGIVLQAPNDSNTYYGYAAGFGSGQTVPQIRITYIK
jgi:hypothetical protein